MGIICKNGISYGGGSDTLADLSDTNISSPTDKQALVYDEATGKWVNGEPKEIADIVNVYGAKNLIPYPYYDTTKTISGITFTDNGDGTVTVNGTATSKANFWFEHYSLPFIYPNGSYLLSDGGVGSSNVSLFFAYYNGTTWVRQSEVADNGEIPITVSHSASSDYDRTLIGITVRNGTTVNNLTFKPMLRLASISDNTYVPYVPTNAKLDEEKISWDDAEKSVKKNLNSYPYNNTNRTTNGITFTDNGDGTVTANGTATADAYFTCHSRLLTEYNGLIVPNGRYILNGCPANGSTSTYMIQAGITRNNTFSLLGRDIGDGAIVTANGDDYFSDKVNIQIQCVVKSGTTVNNIVFKPMIRKATIKDDTFVPYIPDNTELVSWKANGVLGAKNLIPYPYHRESGYSSNGMTATYDNEGVITINKVVGSATAYFALFSNVLYPEAKSGLLPNTKYILSIELENATNTSIYMSIIGVGGDLVAIRNKSTGKYEAQFTTPQTLTGINLGFYWEKNTTETNCKVKPMLRLAEDTDDTYQPYAMTNKELTQKAIKVSSTITYSEFLQMSDAQQLAFTGYVTGWPGEGGGDEGFEPIVLSGTLEAGDTEITFTDSNILANSMIDIFIDSDEDIYPTSKTSSVGEVVLKFDSQENDLNVALLIFNLMN